MSRGSLWACVAIVLAVHGAVAWTVLRAPASRDPTPSRRLASPVRWVRLASVRDPAHASRTMAASDRGGDAAKPRAPAPAPAPVPSARDAEPTAAFLAPENVDVPARPRSAPDTALLEGLQWSGVPMRIRLFVDAAGTVVDVVVLRSNDADDVVRRVRQMFLATGFNAARADGRDVPSSKDIELSLANPS